MQSSRASTHALDAPSRLASAAWAAAGSSSRHKPIATYVDRGEPIANERGPGERALAVRGVRRDALNVTKDTECGGTKCYFPASLQGERGDEGWLVGHTHTFVHVRLVPSQSGTASLGACREAASALIFGVDHLLRGPPFLAALSHEQAMHLNAKIQARLDRQKHPKWHYQMRPSLAWGSNRALPWSQPW